MSPEGQRALTFFAAMGLIVAATVAVSLRLLNRAAGPEAEIFGILKETEDESLRLSIPGAQAPFISAKHHFQRITVEPDLEARTALATATLDLEGKLGRTKVSSLGLERIPFEYRGGDWEPSKGMAPTLAAVLTALEARRRALDAGHGETLARLSRTPWETLREEPDLRHVWAVTDRGYQAEAWFIRSERGEVEVREEYRLTGNLPDRPVDEKGARILQLKEDGGEFFFAAGLM